MWRFLAHLWKMKFVRRWQLMRNEEEENLQEHSWQVAVVAHVLATLRRLAIPEAPDPNLVASAALFHEAGEAIIGDIPTPVKYYNDSVARAFTQLETDARVKVLNAIPDEIRPLYSPFVLYASLPEDVRDIVKTADTICAYLKARREVRNGNRDFEPALRAVEARLAERRGPEVSRFMELFHDSFELTVDELNEPVD
jgi:5'-deoxynucleotidase